MRLLGASERCMHAAARRVAERFAFGASLEKKDGVQNSFGEMRLQIEQVGGNW